MQRNTNLVNDNSRSIGNFCEKEALGRGNDPLKDIKKSCRHRRDGANLKKNRSIVIKQEFCTLRDWFLPKVGVEMRIASSKVLIHSLA